MQGAVATTNQGHLCPLHKEALCKIATSGGGQHAGGLPHTSQAAVDTVERLLLFIWAETSLTTLFGVPLSKWRVSASVLRKGGVCAMSRDKFP